MKLFILDVLTIKYLAFLPVKIPSQAIADQFFFDGSLSFDISNNTISFGIPWFKKKTLHLTKNRILSFKMMPKQKRL